MKPNCPCTKVGFNHPTQPWGHEAAKRETFAQTSNVTKTRTLFFQTSTVAGKKNKTATQKNITRRLRCGEKHSTPISDPKVHNLLVSSKLPKHQLRAALPHLGEPKFPRTGIDVSNTAAVIIAIELLARLMIMKLKCPYDVTIVFDIAYFVKAEA